MNTIGNVTYLDFPRHDLPHHEAKPFMRRCPPSHQTAADTLVERIVLGDLVALDELKTRYQRSLITLACDILDDEDEAERVVEGVFDEAGVGWPPERGQVRNWLRRLVRSAAYARRRALRELDA